MSINEWESRVRRAANGLVGEEITSIGTDEHGGRVAFLDRLGYKITGNTGREIAYIWTRKCGNRYESPCPFAI